MKTKVLAPATPPAAPATPTPPVLAPAPATPAVAPVIDTSELDSLRAFKAKMDLDTETRRQANLSATERADALQAELAETNKRIAGFETEAKERTKALKVKNAARVEAIPEGLRALVPSGLSPAQTAQWLDSSATILEGLSERPAGNAPPASGTQHSFPAAMIKEAAHHNYTTTEQLQTYHDRYWIRPNNPHLKAEA
jgi:hypothetical protein